MDPLGLLVTILFIAGGLSVIPLNDWLDRRQARQRRHQAHIKRRGDRW